MFRRLARYPNRPISSLAQKVDARPPTGERSRLRVDRSLWLASAMLVGACTGEVSGPVGFSSSGQVGKTPPVPSATTNPGVTMRAADGGVLPTGVGDPSTPNGVGWSTRFPKLSNAQWENSVRALLLLDAPTGLSGSFTQEPLDKLYVSLAAAELTIGGDAWARYQTAAETLAAQVVSSDAQLAKLAPAGSFADASAKGAAFIAALGRRAYRRPLRDSEKAAYLTLFQAGATLVSGDPYKAGVRVVLEAMLQSPHFLYRVESSEQVTPGAQKIPLSGDEIATRLSYALWDSMPSDALFAAASAGELDSKDGVARWASTMLSDPRAKDVLLSFHAQTFQVAAYGTQEKDPSLKFDAASLAPMLKQEATSFFDLVVNQQQGGIAQLLTQPTAFVNEDTAGFYGVSGITGKALQKQDLDAKLRTGLLMQLGFLTKNATKVGSDPVHRGLIVVRKVLCDEPDPPPGAFQLPAPVAGLTTRETYTKATACGVGCHDTLINPAGFAFEGFDTLGKLRTTEAGKPIDASGTLTLRQGYTSAEKQANTSTQLNFHDAVDLVTQLAKAPRVHECYARNWMQYVLARELAPAERGAWESLRDVSLSKASAVSLLTELVQLDTFRTRVAE